MTPRCDVFCDRSPLPERGQIGIFNRSYYEEVLIARVHPEILRSQGLPQELRGRKTVWEERYRSIVDFESHLYRSGTRTVKVFLHLSKEEQRKRFLQRIDEPDKNWKFSLSDIHERKYWPQYMKAHEDCLRATGAHHAPWYIVPCHPGRHRLYTQYPTKRPFCLILCPGRLRRSGKCPTPPPPGAESFESARFGGFGRGNLVLCRKRQEPSRPPALNPPKNPS